MVVRRNAPIRTVATVLAAVAILGCLERTVTGPSGAAGVVFAAHVAALGGNSQSGPVSQALPVPVAVRVTDAGGVSVKGATVTFNVRKGAGSISTVNAVSDTNGVASTVWTMGPNMGAQQLVAVLSGALVLDSTVFNATAINGPAAQIIIDAGNGQRGTVGTALATPVSARVTDIGGNAVPGAPVTWTVLSGGGQITTSRQITDSTGHAFATWTLGGTGGQQTAKATISTGLAAGINAAAAPGSASQLILVSGSGQAGLVGAPLGSLLSVRVLDAYGNGVPTAAVSFNATQGSIVSLSGATDSTGTLLARWTLGNAPGLQSALAFVVGTQPVTFVANAHAGNASSVTIETGNNQTQAVRQTLPLPLVAKISDSFGNPVAGMPVTWNVVQGGGILLATSATSDSSGRASGVWTLGSVTGAQLVTLTIPGLPLVVFSATATPGAADTLAIVTGNNQSGTVSTTLGSPLVVRAVDANGNPETGLTVIFAIASGGGVVNPTIATTDVNGRATANWTLGAAPGAQTVTATAGSKSVTFAAVAVAPGGGGGGTVPAQIVLVSGNGQAGNVGAQLPGAVVVKVVDATGLAVPGTTITWTIGVGNAGGFVSPTTSTTDVNGNASTIWLLGSRVGLQTLTASIASPALSLQLIATASVGSSGAILINSGNSQTGPTGGLLPGRLLVKVVDQNNNPVLGARVTWAIASGGGSLTQNAGGGITNAAGLDSASWTLGGVVGTQNVTATVIGVGSVTFTATGTTVGGTAATIRIISGSGQVGRSQQVLPAPLVVEVRDIAGNTLSGITVSFTQALTNTDGFTSPSPVTTAANGQASVTWTLGSNVTNTTVPMAVYATTAGVAAVDTFTATARPEYRIVRIATPFLQIDTTGATIGAAGDYVAGLRDTLRVQVYDPTDSSGVQGVSITWATQATSATDGHSNNSTTVTDNKGFAKTVWVLRGDDGTAIPPSNVAKRMFATASIGQVEFQAHVTPGHACSDTLNSVAANPVVGSTVAMSATVLDCNGYPVPGAVVNFVAAAGSGNVSPASAVTNNAGQAFTSWTLGTSLATTVQTMTATVVSQPVNPYVIAGFPSSQRVVSVVAGAANSVTVVGSPPATAPAGTPVLITVIVRDVYGNVVAGQTVGFAAAGGGPPPGSVSSASGTTNSGGTASVLWTMGGTPGTNTLIVTAGGAFITVTITGT
jgi:protocatechuate 3,4-dioxygenase beta subunit